MQWYVEQVAEKSVAFERPPPLGGVSVFRIKSFLSAHFVWDCVWWSTFIQSTLSKTFSSIVAHLFLIFSKISKFRLIFFTQNRRFFTNFQSFWPRFFGKSELSHASERRIISRGPIVTIRSALHSSVPGGHLGNWYWPRYYRRKFSTHDWSSGVRISKMHFFWI